MKPAFFISLCLWIIAGLLTACSGPSAIAREGWTLIDVVTTGERTDFQTESVDVRNCGLPAAAERKSRSCSAGSSASFSVGAQAQVGADAGVVLAELNVGVGASAAAELSFDRNSGDTLVLETPDQGFVNRYVIGKEFRILTGQGRIEHKDEGRLDGVYSLQTGCYLRIEQVERLTCEEVNTPTPTPTSPPPTSTPTPIPAEPTLIPTRTPISTATNTPLPAAGDTRQIDGIPFVYVPAGDFTMGSNAAEVDLAFEICKQYRGDTCQRSWYTNQSPQHRVYVDGYWIMRTEVTNAQYGRFVDAGGYTTERYWTGEGWAWRTQNNISAPSWWTDVRFNGGDYPVVGVGWYEAVAYANWLAERTGMALRLPTEAEWEKAARGEDGRIYPWGDEWDGSRLNYCDSNCTQDWKDTSQDDGYQYTAPAGSYPAGASPYGVLDMAGNVWEWVQDWYDSGYYADSPLANPTGPEMGTYRVIRGGSWYSNASVGRSAYRHGFNIPGIRVSSMGLRLVAPGF